MPRTTNWQPFGYALNNAQNYRLDYIHFFFFQNWSLIKKIFICSWRSLIRIVIIITAKINKKLVNEVMGICNNIFENITDKITNAILKPKLKAAFSIQSTSLKKHITAI